MKIVCISLLRLGDLILQRPLIEGLKQKHPRSEIHLLINKQFSQVEFLFKGIVDRFIYFDRETFQKSCGEKEYSIFWGLQSLKTLVSDLNQEKYDGLYNLTHNRLTAHIAGLIDAPLKFGIYSQDGHFFGLNNPWIQFFNNYFGSTEAAGFHYTELLAKALEVPLKLASAKSIKSEKQKLILLQPLTSDLKKNWQLEKFRALAQRLSSDAGYTVRVLGAPFEAGILQELFPENELLICDFEKASQHLQQAELLVTGDTSIKHLAAIYEVPILELSLGSSQPLQVGAYSHDSIILQSRLACGPCPHSQPCSRTSHICGERLSVDAVFKAAQIILNSGAKHWEPFAQRHAELNVYKTEIRPRFGWTIECLSSGQKNKFDELLQRKMMIVEELERRHQALSKGVSNEQRNRKLSDGGVEAS